MFDLTTLAGQILFYLNDYHVNLKKPLNHDLAKHLWAAARDFGSLPCKTQFDLQKHHKSHLLQAKGQIESALEEGTK